jgi:hypothetical protein
MQFKLKSVLLLQCRIANAHKMSAEICQKGCEQVTLPLVLKLYWGKTPAPQAAASTNFGSWRIGKKGLVKVMRRLAAGRASLCSLLAGAVI